MRKLSIGILFLLVSLVARAQNGLEGIIVEKYYVSNAADSVGSIGVLPVGSVTYRIYVDMLPGYKFQAAYGVSGHALTLSTTTTFFNNEDRGATTPTYTKTQARGNSVMLDSWLSVGAGCSANFGILKAEDTVATGGATVVNNTVPPILQNNDPAAGIPLTVQDGLYTGAPQAVTFVGITQADLAMLDATSQVGNLFTTSNGSWASLNGSAGINPATNKVLIAQITTNGVFHFELNIQIGTPTGGVENYVAANPVGTEISIPGLTGTFGGSNQSPAVNITSPTTGSSFQTGASVPVLANATDPDGTIASVEFLVDGTTSIGIDNTAPYSVNWTAAAGNHTLTARATDNLGAQTTSAGITVTVSSNAPPTCSITAPLNNASFSVGASVGLQATATDPGGSVVSVEFFIDGTTSLGIDNTSPYSANYTAAIARATDNQGAQATSAPITIIVANAGVDYSIVSMTNPCAPSNFCLPLNAVTSVSNVIGYDLTLNYNTTKVHPSGVITVDNALITPSYVDAVYSNDAINGIMNISLYFNGSAPANAAFTGTGNLMCVEFIKNAGFNAIDSSAFSVSSLVESYFTGTATKNVDPGKYKTYRDSTYSSRLSFWQNNDALAYNSSQPSQYLITKIYGNNVTCTNKSIPFVQPDINGLFNYNINNGDDITIERDIAGTVSVQPIINGFDALLVRKALLMDPTYTPTVYEMISMDVNLDGHLSAGDVSQINQRAVLMIPEFKQTWNYNQQGVSNGQPSKDWLFIDSNTFATNAAYQISSTFPNDNGTGYSKNRIPVIPFCLPVVTGGASACPTLTTANYKGVLLGDINGNFATVGSGGTFRLSDINSVNLDFSKKANNGYIDIPVWVNADQVVNAVDLAFEIDPSVLKFENVIDLTNSLQLLSNYNADDHTVRITSNSVQNYNLNEPVLIIRLQVTGAFGKDQIRSADGFINGERVRVNTGEETNANILSGWVKMYPNPASTNLSIEVSDDSRVEIVDIEGRKLFEENLYQHSAKTIDVSNYLNGVYMVKVSNEKFTSVKRIVISK